MLASVHALRWRRKGVQGSPRVHAGPSTPRKALPLTPRLLQETVLSHTRGSDHNVIIFIASTNKRRWSAGEQAGKQCAFMCTCVCTQPVIDDEPRISCDSTNMQRARRRELSFLHSFCLELGDCSLVGARSLQSGACILYGVDHAFYVLTWAGFEATTELVESCL